MPNTATSSWCYERLALISAGQDGDVYLVRHVERDEKFLLKTLRESTSTGRKVLDRKIRFARETTLTISLDHPAIARPAATVIDDNNAPGIIYPFRNGKTLSSILDSGAIFSPEDAIKLVLPIIEALEYIHIRGIVHCDLNPHNVFVDEENNVQILDFGLALTEEEAQRLPEGHIRGTPPYLSPEQTGLSRNKIDGRSDLFCAGLLLYRLVAERLPFDLKDNTLLDMLDAVLKREIDPLRNVPGSLNLVLLKALRHSPGERYQTAQGFAHDLRLALRETASVESGTFDVGAQDALFAVNRSRVFVGREAEVEGLLSGLRRLRAGSSWSALITGPSGIGKSEIITEFRRSAGAEEVIFISTKCNRFTPHQPFSAFRNLILELLSVLARNPESGRAFRDQIVSRLQSSSGVICRSVPEMREFFAVVDPIDEVEKEVERTAYVLTQTMAAILDIQRTAVIIDDVQWIDRASFAILRDARSNSAPSMLIVCFRTEADGDLLLHGEDVKDFSFDRTFVVKPFGPDELFTYLTRRFGAAEDIRQLSAALAGRSDNRPLAMAEACRWMAANGVVHRTGISWRFDTARAKLLPKKLDPLSLILGKTEGLEKAKLTFLTFAALGEGGIDPSIIAAAAGVSVDNARVSADALEALGFLRSRLDGTSAFAHDGVQEALRERVPERERKGNYDKLTDAIVVASGNNRRLLAGAAEAAMHGSNLRKAIDLCCRAAEFALETAAVDSAVRYYQRAVLMIRSAEGRSVVDAVEAVRIRKELGNALMLRGRNEQALKTFEELLLEPAFEGSEARADLMYRIGCIHHNTGHFDWAIVALKKALGLMGCAFPDAKLGVVLQIVCHTFEQVGLSLGLNRLLSSRTSSRSRLLVRIYNRLTYSLYFYDMFGCLLSNLKAINLADRLDNCFEKSEAYTIHLVPAHQLFLKGRTFRRFAIIREIAEDARSKNAQAFFMSFGGMVHYYVAEFKNGREMLSASNEAYLSIGDPGATIPNYEHLWRIDLSNGSLSCSAALIRKTISLCRQTGEQHFLAATLAAQNFVSLLQGNTVDPLTESEVNNILSQSTSFLTHTHVAAYTCEIDVLNGNPTAAINRIKSLLSDMLFKGFNSEYIVTFYVQACEILLTEREKRAANNTTGDFTFSHAKLALYFRASLFMLGFSTLSYPAYKGAYFRCRARWESLRGLRWRARSLFTRAITANHDLEMRYEEAKSIREYGHALDRWKIPGQARDRFNKAYDLFRLCGAKYDMDTLTSLVDPSCLREVGTHEVTSRKQNSNSTSTTFSMSSEIDRIRLDTLHDLSSTMSTVEDLEELILRILMAQMKVTGAGLGTLFLAPHEGKEQTALSIDYEGHVLPTKDLFFTESILERVKSGAPVLEVGTSKSGDNVHSQSVLCVPLVKGGHSLGCVYLVNETVSGMFTEGAQQIALILAAQAAILIENARLIARYRNLAKNLEQTVHIQTNSLTEKNHELEDKTIKLMESERIKAILTNMIVHDIKNSVTGISGTLQMLNRVEQIPDRFRTILRHAGDACADVTGLSVNLLDIARMDEGKFSANHCSITHDTVHKMYEKNSANPIFAEKNIEVRCRTLHSGGYFFADEYLLGRILQNLFNNAAKYTPSGGQVVFYTEDLENSTQISLFSSGTPIPKEFRERIFEKYSRIEEHQSAYSKGLGLFFCRMAMNAHFGKIWVDPDASGNTFKIQFPHASVGASAL